MKSRGDSPGALSSLTHAHARSNPSASVVTSSLLTQPYRIYCLNLLEEAQQSTRNVGKPENGPVVVTDRSVRSSIMRGALDCDSGAWTRRHSHPTHHDGNHRTRFEFLVSAQGLKGPMMYSSHTVWSTHLRTSWMRDPRDWLIPLGRSYEYHAGISALSFRFLKRYLMTTIWSSLLAPKVSEVSHTSSSAITSRKSTNTSALPCVCHMPKYHTR